MSYDLYVYTPELALEKVTFSIEMLNRGLRVIYLSLDALWENSEGGLLSDHGKLEGQQIIAAWGTDEKRANALEDLVAAQNISGLREIVLNGIGLPACTINVFPFDIQESTGGQDPATVYKSYEPEQLTALQSARYCYHVQTAAGRSELAMDLQEISWKAIAKITGGLAEDPQFGKVSIGEPIPKRNFFQHWFHKLTTPGI